MPVALNEEDMLVVGEIQELKNTTIARAKEYYRKKVNSLANPDVADRAQIIRISHRCPSSNRRKQHR